MLASVAATMTLLATRDCTAVRPPTLTLDRDRGHYARRSCSFIRLLADVFVPDLGVFADEAAEQLEALVGVEIDDRHARLAQPRRAARERARLADHDGADPELAH